ncbi:MAG: 3-oxoacyl-(acyl-carrier-protein) reductase FabG [Pelotomaculum sp. PtaU1.Bin035]|nr:MAG: 3-oxoacyl-(acyl-carrier-protein) reductase FabG [Pelotomaculum sp. PtaU1.Bin035]
MLLKGKVAIVTGARQGIGEGVSMGLAENGADLMLVSRSIKEDDSVVKACVAAGRRVLTMQVDVSKRDQVQEMVDRTVAEFGKVDILFNNAGISKPGMLWKLTEEQWDQVIDVNLKGTFNSIQAVAGTMMAQKSGAIINVTSSAGLLGTIGQVNYTAAKGGVHALTKSAAKELAKYGITVNCIAPLAVTEMTKTVTTDPRFKDKYLERIPMGRFANTEEMAPVVVFLASEGARYITGQTICVDGGMVML